MSKKIRVAWDDLKPGDLIHVKGSTNTYVFKGWFLDAASVDHRKSGAETYVITRSKKQFTSRCSHCCHSRQFRVRDPSRTKEAASKHRGAEGTGGILAACSCGGIERLVYVHSPPIRLD